MEFRTEFRAEFRAEVAHLSIHTVTLRAPPHAFPARISYMHTVSAREIPRPRTCICIVNYSAEFYRYLSYCTLYGYVQRLILSHFPTQLVSNDPHSRA
eukprot:COSAG01_NODE_28267_length_665_cov_1.044170_1_plen_98_part_00